MRKIFGIALAIPHHGSPPQSRGLGRECNGG
jgi:hypothetical protein